MPGLDAIWCSKQIPSTPTVGVHVNPAHPERTFQVWGSGIGGVHVAFLDGQVRFVAESIDQSLWNAILTRDADD